MLLLVYCSFSGAEYWRSSLFQRKKVSIRRAAKVPTIEEMNSTRRVHLETCAIRRKHTNYCEERATQSWHLISVMAYQWQIGKVSGSWHKNRSNSSIRWALRNYKSSHNTIWSVEYDSKQNNGRRKVFVRRRKVSWWLGTTDWSNIRFSPRANLWTLSTR